MGAEPYSEQLIGALQQLRARVIEVRAGQYSEQEQVRIDLELMQKIMDAQTIARRWQRARGPAFPPPGAGLEALREYARLAADVAALDGELEGALQAIHPDLAVEFSVEAIDNAIGVAEDQDC